MIGRIPILEIEPTVDFGRWPARAVAEEAIAIEATIFREGHDAVAAEAVLIRPNGEVAQRSLMSLTDPGLDRWRTTVTPDQIGDWSFHIEAWSDPYGTWAHDAVLKIEADVDTELMLTEGALLLQRAAGAAQRSGAHRRLLLDAVRGLHDASRPAQARLAAGTSAAVRSALTTLPVRELVTVSAQFQLRVQRERALVGAWYEFFPRSEGATQDPTTGKWRSGTLRTAAQRLPAIAAMGFDVAYLTPIHPIGRTHRKGPNNTLNAGPDDPGSPYAIGSEAGGHDALEPGLGTFADWEYFVAKAKELNLEIALDLALQCSPDHPWVREHPQWFTTRADGSISYAENPPKKYQDIYPLNFDDDPRGLYSEILRVVMFWIEKGVTLFRVDNPHTKPLEFWEWLIAEVAEIHPEVIFLAEAFTRPAMMHTLGKIGFHQSYTYFTWRETKAELVEYLTEITGPSANYMRPNFWPTTHDILTPQLQFGGRPAFKVRSALAATMVPSYGIYSGYELIENIARPGAQEQLDNEKYEFKPRNWELAAQDPNNLAPWLTLLNGIRRAHPALQRLRNFTVHETSDESIICFSKRLTVEESPLHRDDTIIVVANLDPHAVRESQIELDLPALGLRSGDSFVAHDLITRTTWHWQEHVYVRLDPQVEPVHIVHLRKV